MADAPTAGDLVKAKVFTADDVELLMSSYLAAPTNALLPLGPQHRLNVQAAIEAHSTAPTVLANPGTSDGFRRTMIRIAILMARPEKA